MELQDRLNKIKAKGQSILEQREKAEQERIEKRKGLINKITSLAPRIKKLIMLGNELYKQGLLNDYFYTDGWLHCLGFNKAEESYKFATDNTPIKFMGIECGGACGDTDLWVDSEGSIKVAYTFGFWNKSGTLCDTDKIDTWVLGRFVENFDTFEKRLLDYVDSL